VGAAAAPPAPTKADADFEGGGGLFWASSAETPTFNAIADFDGGGGRPPGGFKPPKSKPSAGIIVGVFGGGRCKETAFWTGAAMPSAAAAAEGSLYVALLEGGGGRFSDMRARKRRAVKMFLSIPVFANLKFQLELQV
jgi:hypothetical protein